MNSGLNPGMMRHAQTTRDQLATLLVEASQDLKEPIFRGLDHEACEEYKKEGQLNPKSGNFSVGTGVFFTNNPVYAQGFAKTMLVITTRATLDPQKKAIDTRIEGYDTSFRHKLDEERGGNSYDAWTLWEEIQKHDTITYEGGPQSSYVFTKRTPVTRERILVEVTILDESESQN
jgi:hypothetical protein